MVLAKAYNIDCSPACERLLAFAAAHSPQETPNIAQSLATDTNQGAVRLAEQIASAPPEHLADLIHETLGMSTGKKDLLGLVRRIVQGKK